MNTAGLLKYAAALLALVACSACGGGSALAPSSAVLDGGYTGYVGKTLSVNGRLVTAARMNLGARPSFAPILPDLRSKEKFEYVINFYSSYASIFDWPKSDEQVGTIDDVGGQGCTNVLYGYGKRTFWIVAGADQITEYAVPRKPIQTLSDSVGQPSSCAMNTRGDLAVGILHGADAGNIVIFKNARGSGSVVITPLSREFFDGYDNRGNLFADGLNSRMVFELVERPAGERKVQTITTSNTVRFPGSVQWDGKYLTITDQLAGAIYQYTVSGTKAILKGTVTLLHSSDCAQTWIATGVVYCGDSGNSDGEVYKYPAGGLPIAVFTGNFDEPLGVVAAQR